MDTIITLTEEEYWELSNAHAGICYVCGELDDCAGCEPDARKYRCGACGERALYGLEWAMVEGKVGIEC